METKKASGIAKRLILGKNKPSLILRILCWFSIIWDTILGIYFSGSGLVIMMSGIGFTENPILKDFTKEFCFSYASLHLLSLCAAILLYRQKKSGFYLYVITNLILMVIPFFYLENYSADYVVVIFTLLLIGLFASQFKKLS